MEENNKDIEEIDDQSKAKEIDVLAMVYKLYSNWKVLLAWSLCGVLVGLVIAFSIPREFSTTVKLAPEYRTRTNMASGLSALASMAGISTSVNSGTDAVYPQLYPDIVASVPFAMSLLDVKVKDKDNKEMTVEDYLLEKTKGPWWNVITGAPRKVIGAIRNVGKSEESSSRNAQIDSLMKVDPSFKLSSKEAGLVGALRGRIRASVDQKTNMITITTEMQDPMVSAILADTVVARLREYITNYRTNKARKDLEYAERLNSEAQQEYYKAQQTLADYIDRNQNLATQSARINRERLTNEATLAFNLYNETSLQVQNAKSKVQETTPVYTVITPATVPIQPISPRKGLIIGGCTFLAFVICAAWILFGEPVLTQYKTKVNELKLSHEQDNNPENQKGEDNK